MVRNGGEAVETASIVNERTSRHELDLSVRAKVKSDASSVKVQVDPGGMRFSDWLRTGSLKAAVADSELPLVVFSGREGDVNSTSPVR